MKFLITLLTIHCPDGAVLHTEGHEGMDLRDYFAANASRDDVIPFAIELAEKAQDKWGYLPKFDDPGIWIEAKWAYADTMMEARK